MKPNTRIDNFLAKIAGDPDANTAMKPRSPEEYYLNQIAENGGGGGGSSGGGVLVVNENTDTGALDKTWQEINDAPLAVVANEYGGTKNMGFVVQTASVEGYGYMVVMVTAQAGQDGVAWTAVPYSATTADSYPIAMT